MKNKYFIENRSAMRIVEDVSHYGSRLNNNQLREELKDLIIRAREYCSTYRNGGYDHLINLPCGYQDSHGDMVEAMFNKLEALKTIYRLRQGDMTRFKKHVDRAAGLC